MISEVYMVFDFIRTVWKGSM